MNTVAARKGTLAGASCCSFRRQNFALGKVFRIHGVSPSPKTQIQKKAPQGVLSFVWRWARDSNPGNLSVQRFSRPPLSTTQPAHLNCLPGRLPAKSAHYIAALVLIKMPPLIPLFVALEDHCLRAAHHAQSLLPAAPRFARTIGPVQWSLRFQ